MANSYPVSLNNYTGNETLSAAGHAQAHNAYEAKIGTGSSTPTSNTYLKGTGTGTSEWSAFSIDLTTDVTGTLPVANGGTGVTSSTGTVAVVLSTSPTLVTPILGVATATSINKVAITAPASSATLTIANGKTLTASNTLTLAGTDSTTITFQATDTYVGRATTDTLTNKTINSTTNTIGTSTLLSFNSPEAYLINGRISTSISSNDLVVAIKGVDGNDASATNPVYIRIGNSIRTLTAALSITLADGTNYFHSGDAELGTLEIDYFVYLGWNAGNSAIRLGFSRFPYGKLGGDLSATNTAETYLARSGTIDATDEIEVVGRFNAILSLSGTSHVWTIPATSIILNYPIFQTRNLAWTPVWTGFSADPTIIEANYVIDYCRCTTDLIINGQGTSNATTTTVTTPVAPTSAFYFLNLKSNSGAFATGSALVNTNKTIDCYNGVDLGGTAWTNSGSKSVRWTGLNYRIK